MPVPKWITGTDGSSAGEQPGHVRLDEPPIVVRAERADPAIEDLKRLCAGGRLGIQVEGGRVGQTIQKRVPGPRVADT